MSSVEALRRLDAFVILPTVSVEDLRRLDAFVKQDMQTDRRVEAFGAPRCLRRKKCRQIAMSRA